MKPLSTARLIADAILTAITTVFAVLLIAGYTIDLGGLGW